MQNSAAGASTRRRLTDRHWHQSVNSWLRPAASELGMRVADEAEAKRSAQVGLSAAGSSNGLSLYVSGGAVLTFRLGFAMSEW